MNRSSHRVLYGKPTPIRIFAEAELRMKSAPFTRSELADYIQEICDKEPVQVATGFSIADTMIKVHSKKGNIFTTMADRPPIWTWVP